MYRTARILSRTVSDPGLKIGTQDVDALYPDIDRSLVMEALQLSKVHLIRTTK